MKTYFIGLVAIVLLVPLFAFAGTFVANEEVSVTTGSVIEDNLYLAGGIVSVGDQVAGDLIAAGGQLLITGDVTEDITLAGGNLTVLGNTGGDVRMAGGSVLIAGTVGGDLVGAGGTLTVAPNATVGKDLILAGGQMSVGGDIAGDVELTGGVATLNARVQGDVIAHLEEPLTIGDGAVIEGNLTYYAPSESMINVTDGANVNGTVVFEETHTAKKAEVTTTAATMVGTFMLYKLLAMLTAALILAGLFKRYVTTVTRQAVNEPLKLFGLGFVTLVVTPIAALLLLITLLGIPLAILILLGYLFLFILANALSGVVVGAWLSQVVYKSNELVVTWKNVIVGVVVLFLIQLVPIVGWIVCLAIFLLTLGSLMDSFYRKVWVPRK